MEAEGTMQGYIKESQVEKEPSKKCRVDAPLPSANSCFDCNICLDFVSEPVVTLCGHLFCWPCIYKWLHVQTTSPQQCPVCKAPLSEDTLVPLYGRGLGNKKESDRSLEIPHRPSIYRDHALISSVIEHQSSSRAHEEEHFDIHPPMPQPQLPHHHHDRQYYPYSFGFMSAPSSLLAAPVFHSTAGGVLGELAVAVFPSVFRNQEAGLYYRSRQYDLTASMNSPRWRRQQMQVESSLHQLWLFLFCCAVLCLLLF
ncbi:E3 ubiquitin-protein ligase RMA3-like [Phoenix dactylifera]|uniref:E3 ubiquitin-protein ligase RMA n=1 Tax=Phoenix dactylifera TaxID=42345 RepID=A0A8B8JCC2_PHODC|nr:E3 ubiquitin-protein ligase RMA3-like [Phoenix dactylifera]XP_026666126.1 E3 ubiquitin-protein ligase RMA3-like [Phoenix dactylifera]XP_038971100.1 E3 ubiquitin-protein ligase RMA3-like [Phoenix dactylifera]